MLLRAASHNNEVGAAKAERQSVAGARGKGSVLSTVDIGF